MLDGSTKATVGADAFVEVDSILVDEARTPLIISRQTDAAAEARWADEALGLARALDEGRDYRIRREERRLELTPQGCERLSELAQGLDATWESRIRRARALPGGR